MPSSLLFDGDNNYVDLGTIGIGNPLMLAGSAGSILAWCKIDTSGDSYQRIIDKSNYGTSTNGYGLTADGNAIVLQIDGSNWTLIGGLQNQVWTPVAATWDGSSAIIYVWGEIGLQVSTTKVPPNVSTNARIGTWNHSTGREWKGNLRDISVHNTDLSQSQIRNWITTGITPPENLVGHWKLEDGSGTTATDETGNNDGTLTNGPTWDSDYPWVLDEFGGGVARAPRMGVIQ